MYMCSKVITFALEHKQVVVANPVHTEVYRALPILSHLMLRSAQPASKQRKCLHEHWKNCHNYPEAHTWESRAQEDIKEEAAIRILVQAEDDSYLSEEEACRIRQLEGYYRTSEGHVTRSCDQVPDHGAGLKYKSRDLEDGRTVPGHSSQWNLAEDSCVLKTTNNDKERLRDQQPGAARIQQVVA
ncbi:hypothetical protein EI94DRAFT_1696967 [Lactarius quietus]|nr:hypothetical protein EI94DRAFT_1696967 [Lactarius quietus]